MKYITRPVSPSIIRVSRGMSKVVYWPFSLNYTCPSSSTMCPSSSTLLIGKVSRDAI